ncbi:exosome catalytic subunit dis3 [Cladochytrium tenue]|nr:exosome catalytic subunit dis3 [Cladochytrium tenue]
MLHTKSFVRKTRRGAVVKVVKEHYLRDDIYCGVQLCRHCPQLKSPLEAAPASPVRVPIASKALRPGSPHFIVPDTNVLYHQIDLIEHEVFKNVIVLQTVLQELRHRSLQIYSRVRALIAEPTRRFWVFSNEFHRETYIEKEKDETANDRNDRAIRVATKWYASHELKGVSIVLLSDDQANRVKAGAMGLIAVSVRDYVESLTSNPELVDMIAAPEEDDAEGGRHFSYSEGSIFAKVNGTEKQLLLRGRLNLNRAVQGDVVAVEVFPTSQWITNEEDVLIEPEDDDGEMDIEAPKKEEKMDVDTPADNAKPTGRVVGIIKRNWRPYCGTIELRKIGGKTQQRQQQNVFFWPMDKRVPKIRLRTRQAEHLAGRRIIVAMDSWSKTSRYPTGHFVRNLGDVGDRKTETDVLLLEYDVPFSPFSKQEMTPDAEVVNVKFAKSAIRSRASFTYDEAQARLDDPTLTDPVSTGIKLLNKIAKKLRARRMENGALVLASPEVRFSLDRDAQDPVDVELKEMKDTNALVEEFMLLANIHVATKIFSVFPDSSMLRRHPKPPATNFDGLIRAAKGMGVTIDPSTNKTLSDSLDRALVEGEPYFNKLIRIMTTRCMMQAVYFCSGTLTEEDFWHYGLASKIYTHFTSPIRRYAGPLEETKKTYLVVHRLLAACIGFDKTYSADLVDKIKVAELTDVLNYRNRMAQQAARSSVELYTNLFFKNRNVQEEAYIIRVLKNGFVVLIPRYGIEGIVHITPKDAAAAAAAPALAFDADRDELTNAAAGVTLRLFARVVVRVQVEEAGNAAAQRSKLAVHLVEPVVPGLSVDPLPGGGDAPAQVRRPEVVAL